MNALCYNVPYFFFNAFSSKMRFFWAKKDHNLFLKDQAKTTVWTNFTNSTKKRASRAPALRADETQHARGLVLTPYGPVPPLEPNLKSLPVDPLPSHPIINYQYIGTNKNVKEFMVTCEHTRICFIRSRENALHLDDFMYVPF